MYSLSHPLFHGLQATVQPILPAFFFCLTMSKQTVQRKIKSCTDHARMGDTLAFERLVPTVIVGGARYQLYNVDVWITVVAVLLVFFYVSFKILRFLCRLLFCGRNKKQKYD
ncbi:hypothetical protein E2C01_023028 [Portunus trituberculatus]|uniref:Uncharacterized protein n=1 Tax=Portunus trituberculatus TaxID=210409 RepID=A0A5B7E8N5_PORTR|nr:hypothetical protein [Portunus trituberculatus]